MSVASSPYDQRLAALERRLLRTQLVATGTFLIAAVVSLGGWVTAHQTPRALHTRSLVVEDSLGRAMVVLGAPVPDPKGGPRRSPSNGMVINDTAGAERFGVGLNADGGMAMGFDAPPGVDRGNRERITLGVAANGGSEVRFLDHEGYVRAHINLFPENDVALFFEGRRNGKMIVHRVDAAGDTVVVHNQ